MATDPAKQFKLRRLPQRLLGRITTREMPNKSRAKLRITKRYCSGPAVQCHTRIQVRQDKDRVSAVIRSVKLPKLAFTRCASAVARDPSRRRDRRSFV